MGTTRTRSGGFSLIEVIVVVGMIALLLAILLPALIGTRRKAGAVACLSNLRQVGQALTLYANQADGRLPACCGWHIYPDAGDGPIELPTVPAAE